ncbi:amino acid adenylation domain-containing protein [Ruminiclostridium sufflavum DSM 19573]|uniref:Amino acid adenylation domain-containing protein n=1 Tax=Ruminiclostridium sufflavum DSM 19573 TaxID=1121337 RepID=A0A318XKE0_9FIRM|nr:non-ribosomal peptide synthetase [Ruminiclostridium sufflavum]PYG87831.1 amino acid adenylation domain-containing protein [Ruminiclostridium sufflavum DSM 19573]
MDLSSLIFEQSAENDNEGEYGITEETTRDIAVIGIAGKVPMAENIDAFWDNLVKGKDCITDFPGSRRKDADIFAQLVGIKQQGRGYNNGSYFKEIDKFDCGFFKISPKEASLMSPDQKIFLETVWQAVEDAGYGNDRLRGSNTGIYFGYSADALFDYKRLIERVDPELLIDALPGNLSSVIPARISYLLDLKGPSLCVDTACSSSLVAIHLACKALRNMECEAAIAGSVKINILPVKSSKRLGIESSDGRARTFDESSDGTGMGEGVAAVLLKPLSRALRDGDNIYAVIKGTAANQDGNSIGITAPNAEAQRDVIISALQDAGVSCETISYIEAHGTGTQLGDPIEIEGITRAYKKFTDKKQFCAIGSVKTNIGHLDCASGIIGFIKAVLCLRNKKLPASLHFNRPNKKISFGASPVYVNSFLSDWNSDFPRRCGVSAFGLSGTNCHVILEEAPKQIFPEETEEMKANLLALSAKTENSLKQLVIKYNELIDEGTKVKASDLCFSANTGRWHYGIRIGIVFEAVNELSAALKQLRLEGIRSYPDKGIFFSEDMQVRKQEEPAFAEAAAAGEALNYNKACSGREALLDLCIRYAEGQNIDFGTIYKNNAYRRVRLPEYPFERKRCWLNIPEEISIARDKTIQAVKSEKAVEYRLRGREDGAYTDAERMLGKLWCTALGYDEININDDFYELGGDSIIAIQIANEYKKQTGVKIDAGDIMEYSSLSLLSSYLEDMDAVKKADVRNIMPAGDREYYPLSSAQKRMYIINRFDGIGVSYNMPVAISIEGCLDVGRLKNAVKEIVKNHDAFRMSFHINENVPVMKVHKEVELELDEIECSAPEKLPALIKSFVEPFDMEKAPLFRAKVIKISDSKHVLFIDMHHIITDGMSSVIFDRELVKAYLGEELKKPEIQYADYAVWQNEQLKSEKMKRQEEYWLGKFEGEKPVLELPIDFQRPSIQSFEGDRVIFEADCELTERILRLSEKTGTTLYMVLMSVYKILLSKYTGQEDIIVASPVTDRKAEELQNVIGMFVNTVVIRSCPCSDKPFIQYLHEVKQIVLEAFANSDYPFEDIINRINLKRDMSRTPLFDTMLTLQNTEKPELESGGLKFGQIEFENSISKFDLNLNIFLQDNGDSQSGRKLKFDMEYCTSLFGRETIERLVKHFINIFDEVTKNPEIKIKNIRMLSADEYQAAVYGFNNTRSEYPRDKAVHSLFEENARKYPDNIAVETGGRKITYAGLSRKSGCLAAILREKGAGRGSVVAINAHRSSELMIGILAVLKAGAAYLPIDPVNPDGRISYMIADSGVKIVLTLSDYCERLEKLQTGAEIINLQEEELYTGEYIEQEASVEASDAAYVIYTSGSTGKPKGVVVEHHSLMNFLFCINNTFDRSIGEKDKAFSLTSISFDVSVCEMFLPLAFGASLVFFGERMISDIGSLCDTIAEKGITFAYIPPTILWEVSQQLMKSRDRIKLDKMLVGVEGIKDYVLEEFLKLNPEMSIINGYGPTEDTVCATFYRYKAHEPEGKNVPIGKPLANTEIYILDRDNNPVPVGVTGELCISGDGLARGYLNRPELTEEKFVINPFYLSGCFPEAGIKPDDGTGQSFDAQAGAGQGSELYQRMYKTGDLARRLSDGTIEFLGRKDHQIKIRGYRVELGEIESCLLRHESVREAVVAVRQENNGLKSLIAYIVSEGSISANELKSYLGKELPDYMVPSFFVMLDSIPVTANGKVDRNALPEPDRSIVASGEYEAPGNLTEERLAGIWQSILGIDRIGVNDYFFDLGGDSIKAIQVVSSVNKEFNAELPAGRMYSNPTVREIAGYIEEYRKGAYTSAQTEAVEQGEQNYYDVKESLVLSKAVEWPKSMELKVAIQKDITAYLHRSLPLCAILPHDKYLPWYYSSFIQIFSFIDREGKLFVDYMEPCSCYNEILHLVNIAFHLLNGKEKIIDFIIEKISLGYCLMMFVDEYYLPDKWAYKKKHFIHPSLIYGYDNEREQLRAIGFDRNMLFTELIFNYSEFREAYQNGKTYYKETAPWCELTAIQLIRPNGFEEEYPYSNYRVLKELKDYIFGVGDKRRLYSFMYPENHTVFGMQVYDEAVRNLENLFMGKATIDYRAMHMLWEHKKGIYDRIEYLISRNRLTGEIIPMHKEYTSVVDLSNNIRIKCLEMENKNIDINGLSVEQASLIENIIQSIKRLKSTEYDILLKIYRQLELDLAGKEYCLPGYLGEADEALPCAEEKKEHHGQVPDKSWQKDIHMEYLGHIGAKKSDMAVVSKETEECSLKMELKVVMQMDITTYLHRSLPLCIVLAYNKYLPWYYGNFIQIFSFTDDNGYMELNYLEPRDCSSEILDMVCLGYHLLEDTENIIDFIIKKLNRGHYLVINVDEYYLSDKWAYRQNHFVHSSLIYGYDNEEEQLKAISFDRDMLFTKMIFDYTEFSDAYENGKIHYKKTGPWCESSAIQLFKPKGFEGEYPFSNEKFLKELKSYIFSTGDRARLYSFEYPEKQVSFGIMVYNVLISNLENMLQGNITADYRAFHMLAEHKKGIYDRLDYVISRNLLSEKAVLLKEKYTEVVNLANGIRMKGLEYSYKAVDGRSDSLKHKNIIKDIIGMVKNLKNTEYNLLLEIYNQLEEELN